MKHQARKRFGQNFLHDKHVIQQILQCIAVKSTDHIVEIGPGLGALTDFLQAQTKQMDVIEIDRDLVTHLQGQFPHLHIHQTDALTFDFNKLRDKQLLRIVGNLPYNISTPLIFHLLSFVDTIQDIHVMLQKEVVDRIAAFPNTADYGRLSIMVQYHCQAQKLLLVSPRAFNPQPKVQSAIVRLTPYKKPPFLANDYQQFSTLVRLAFNQRRKMLKVSLKSLLPIEASNQLDIDLTRRPETLTVEDFVRLSNIIDRA